MAMKLVKKTEEYSIYLRGDQRYAVKDDDQKPVNGDEKARILAAEGLIKVAPPVAKPAEENASDEGAGTQASAGEAAPETAAEGAADEEAPAGEAADSAASQADK